MSSPSTPAHACDVGSDHCQVCGDDAIVARVVQIDGESRTAIVAHGGGLATIALDLVDASVGDEVLVHMGFAIERTGER